MWGYSYVSYFFLVRCFSLNDFLYIRYADTCSNPTKSVYTDMIRMYRNCSNFIDASSKQACILVVISILMVVIASVDSQIIQARILTLSIKYCSNGGTSNNDQSNTNLNLVCPNGYVLMTLMIESYMDSSRITADVLLIIVVCAESAERQSLHCLVSHRPYECLSWGLRSAYTDFFKYYAREWCYEFGCLENLFSKSHYDCSTLETMRMCQCFKWNVYQWLMVGAMMIWELYLRAWCWSLTHFAMNQLVEQDCDDNVMSAVYYQVALALYDMINYCSSVRCWCLSISSFHFFMFQWSLKSQSAFLFHEWHT